MQLSKFSDYAVRTLMHLAAAEEHMLTTKQVARIHDAKYNHLAKVTQWLVREGYVVSLRGRTGGLRLAMDVEQINVGEVLRALESQSELVECMKADGGNCVLSPLCPLTSALRRAQAAFFDSLSQLTLKDLTNTRRPIGALLVKLNDGTDE